MLDPLVLVLEFHPSFAQAGEQGPVLVGQPAETFAQACGPRGVESCRAQLFVLALEGELELLPLGQQVFPGVAPCAQFGDLIT